MFKVGDEITPKKKYLDEIPDNFHTDLQLGKVYEVKATKPCAELGTIILLDAYLSAINGKDYFRCCGAACNVFKTNAIAWFNPGGFEKVVRNLQENSEESPLDEEMKRIKELQEELLQEIEEEIERPYFT